MARRVTVIALCVALAGAMIIVGPTFGFSTLAADRGVIVDVADDSSSANLGLESESDVGEIRGDDEPVQVGTLYNNFGEEIDTFAFDITNDDGALAVVNPDYDTVVQSDDSEPVTIECVSSDSPGTRTITIEVVEASGETVSVQGASFTATVDIQCNKGGGTGAVNFQANDVTEGDTSQTFSFNADGLKNMDTAYIDLSDPQQNGGVDYSSGTPTLVSGSGSVQYDSQNDQIVYTAQGNEKGTVEIRMDNIDVVGDSGERYTVEYTEDRSGSTNRNDGDIFYISS